LSVLEVSDALGVPHLMGGSLDRAVQGVARAPLGADLVVGLRHEHAGGLAQALRDAFYADVEAIQDAILEGRS
jgi:hypothetical protein